MLNAALIIARKDLRLLLRGGAGIVQPLLLGLLLIFVFSLAQRPGDVIQPQTAATVFWLASAFCLVLAGSMLHSLEEADGARFGLLLAPVPVQALWLGKAFGILAVLLLAQAVFLPAAIAFLRQELHALSWWVPACLLLIDIGLAAAGSLLGALSRGRSARESLLSVLLFPLILPLLLAGIHCGDLALSPGIADADASALDWLGIAAAFDAVFLAAGLILFPFIFTGED